MTKQATKKQIIEAQASTIFHLMNKAMSAAIEADKSAQKGEINITASYLMDLAPLAESIKTLADSTLTLHRTLKEEEYQHENFTN